MLVDCRDEDVDILGRVNFPIPPFEKTRQDMLLRLRKALDEYRLTTFVVDLSPDSRPYRQRSPVASLLCYGTSKVLVGGSEWDRVALHRANG
jgi:hypothetical protein